MKYRNDQSNLLFFALVGLWTLAFHFLFSPYGFNPTDDGFFLAVAQRLLQGQKPYIDFVSQRPVLSSWLHAPIVLWGGNYTYLISRFAVCCQWSTIAWIWTDLIMRVFAREELALRLSLFALIFALNLHDFPLYAWPTVDAIFVLSLGTWLIVTRPQWMGWGYALVGCAGLMRQNFLLAPLLFPLLCGHFRQWLVWLYLMSPLLAYVAWVASFGGLSAMISQVFVHSSSLIHIGVLNYLTNQAFQHMALGVVVALALASRSQWRRWACGLWLVLCAKALVQFLTDAHFGWEVARSFGIAALAAGAVAWSWFLTTPLLRSPLVRLQLCALVIAWSASVSLGYNSIALMSGVLLAFSLLLVLNANESPRWLATPLTAGFAIVAVAGLVHLRLRYTEREPDRSQMVNALDEVLPGGHGIYSHGATYQYLRALKEQIGTLQTTGRAVAILPDFPGYWAQSPASNPLACDWPQFNEVSAPLSRHMLEQGLLRQRGHVSIVVAKKDPRTLDYQPYAEKDLLELYPIVSFVRSHFTLRGENDWFWIYQ